MKNILSVIIASLIIAFSLSSCGLTYNCHASIGFQQGKPSVSFQCDSINIAQILSQPGSKIVLISEAAKAQNCIVKAGSKVAVKIKVHK